VSARRLRVEVLDRPWRRAADLFAHVVTEPGPDGHRHCATVDEHGRGGTSAGPDGHVHLVSDLGVLEAAGHRHELTAERCPGPHRHRSCLAR
jgi:hypothetical protein